MRENPIDIFLRLGLQTGIIEQPRQRDEAVKEVRASLPRFACTAKPTAVGSDVRPGLVEMSAETPGLDFELPPQPSGGTYGAQGKSEECARVQRSAVLNCGYGSSIIRGEE
jgi:hypothetical protein